MALGFWHRAIGLALLVVAPGACSLILGDPFQIDPTLGAGGAGGGPVPCNVDSQCAHENPCTKSSCGPDKTCIFEALDGVPSPDQAAGDCKTVQCVKGEAVDKPDDNDVPDDGKDCTIDSCAAGNVSHVPEPVDTGCLLMGNAGTCDAQGECKVICTTVADCVQAPPNPCVTPTCDTTSGHCQYQNSSNSCASCAGFMLTPGSCSGTGSCTAGTATPCGGHLICQSATACLIGCGTSDANCVSPYVCDNMGACKLADGASCTANGLCASGACGIAGSGNCCAAACPTTGPCAAISCNSSGACVGPGSGTSCNSCTGNMLSTGSCSGSGTCTSGGGNPCAFNLLCQDATSCFSDCLTGGVADDTKCVATKTCNMSSGHCL